MDPSGLPSLLLSSPRSPTQTPCPSLQKTSNSAQHHSPQRQCTYPCEPFQSKLKAAKTLMSFELYPVPMLHPFPYPCDTITGKHIPVAELRKYSREHVWPDGMHCFCSLRPGSEARSVQLFFPSQGIMQGSPCLGCPDWTLDGTSGCGYFVKLNELFKDSESLFGTDIVQLSNFPLRGNNRKRTKTRHTTGGARAPASTASLLFEPGNSASERSALDIQDHAPSLLRVKPVSILNPARIPPSLVRQDLPIPADSVVQEVFDEMLNGSGVPYHRLMAVIGSCVVCDQVVVLSKILTHPCLGRTKEPGPHPSKHPRLPEDGRVLPTAGSRLKELEVMRAIIGTDHQGNNGRDAESSDKIIDSPTHKRRLKFNLPSQHVFIRQPKKRRITNTGGPSRMTPVSSQPAEIVDLTGSSVRVSTPVFTQPAGTTDFTSAEIVDLTGSPVRVSTPVFTQPAGTTDFTSAVRIPTPNGLREVYRDVNGEFIMYEKA